MLRRQIRLRKEYLYRKAQEKQRQVTTAAREAEVTNISAGKTYGKRLKRPHEEEEAATEAARNPIDDEYRWAGVEDPKIVLTSSISPSSRLKMFVKEMSLIFPNAQRINRGSYGIKEIIDACRANNVTDCVIIHECQGKPDNLIICHLPYGPTAYFTLFNVVMRHDIPDIGTMSEAYPHLIFHNFKSKLGERAMNVLKYLFPVPKEDSKRIMTFVNDDDYISFRHHVYKKGEQGKDVELTEVGPRFEMKLYMIKLGTLDEAKAADDEFVLKPFHRTVRSATVLSNDNAFGQQEI